MTGEMLALLVCPATRTPLRWDQERRELISDAAGVAYPVRDGVPVLLIEKGRILSPPHAEHGEGDQA